MNYRPLEEVLAEIGRLSTALLRDIPPQVPAEHQLKRLTSVLAKLAEPKKSKPAKCPADYISLWNRVGTSNAAELSGRAVRYLSWETEIAITPQFQVVALAPNRLSSRSLQGLVRSVHRRWKKMKDSPSLSSITSAIDTYAGKNPLIEKWKRSPQHVLQAD